jgi:uncharacterized protein (TIGR02246 family)
MDLGKSGQRRVAVVVALAGLVLPGIATAGDAVAELRQAAAAYVEAFQKGDAAGIADQWTERATLTEGGETLEGREAITAALVAWRKQHPEGKLAVEAEAIDLVAEPLARVSGTILFTPRPGVPPRASRFTSLRVREGTTWRIAESVVIPQHEQALDDLGWLVGTWRASDGAAGDDAKTDVELTYDKPVGDFVILGRIRYQRAGKPLSSALEVIYADQQTGMVRSQIFDATGSRAEGVIESDGTTLHKTMTGKPSEGAPGAVARWVQVIAPTGEGRCTVHAIERSIDGVTVPDGEPLHFRKVTSP